MTGPAAWSHPLRVAALCITAWLALAPGVLAGAPDDGAGHLDVRYLGPGATVGPTGFVGAPAADACPLVGCPGGTPSVGPLAVLPPGTYEVTVRLSDDLHGQSVRAALCLSSDHDGLCEPGNTVVGPLCGPFVAWFVPPPGEVIVYGVAGGDPACADPVKGTATLDFRTS